MTIEHLSYSTLTESVEGTWVIWFTSIVLLGIYVIRSLRSLRWESIESFLRDDEGASYALPYVLTLPFLLLIFCCALQGTLVLLVKFGTVHAAYAASRSASVWQGADPQGRRSSDLVEFHADRAAVLAMTPFASGVEDHFSRAAFHFNPSAGGMDAYIKSRLLYVPMYRRMADLSESARVSRIIKNADQLAGDDYVHRKLRFAAFMTNASVTGVGRVTPFNRDVKVKVTYSMPLHIPMAAPLFSSHGFGSYFAKNRYYAKEISTTVTLPSEAAQTRHGRLEIPYFPDQI